jgi:acyl-CoA thioesterase-1
MTPKSVAIVFMGDSISAGQYVETGLRWTDKVSAYLQKQFLSTPINLLFLNRGVTGETTRQGLERFPSAVQNGLPDIVTLQFGLNDCNCWVSDRGLPRVSLRAFSANLVEMIERMRRFGTKRIILSTNQPTLRRKILMSGECLDDSRKRYNEAVREVARETGVTLCDIDQAFRHIGERELAELLLPYPDQLHLSIKGHELYASAILPYVESALDEVVKGT